MDERIAKLMGNLEKRNYSAIFCETGKQAVEEVRRMILPGATVGLGGSLTVKQVGLLEMLRSGRYTLIDQYEDGISYEENLSRRRRALLSDYFITGSNAITVDGEIVNIDGLGNRTAAMLYGPSQVIILIGSNKICDTLDEALNRVKFIAAPKNAARLNAGTPCVDLGQCRDCTNVRRICNYTVIMHRQNAPGRCKVLIINEDLGY